MEADKGADQASEPVLRREPRNATNWIATIRLPDGGEIPCTVKDVSKSGAKLGVPAYHVLPKTFLLRIIGRDFLCMVTLAWRRGDYIGVRIERVGKVTPPSKDTSPSQGRDAAARPPVVRPPPDLPIVEEPGGIGVRSRRRGLMSY